MNPVVLKQARSVLKQSATEFRDKFKIFSIDTSSSKYLGKQGATCEAVARKILDWISESIEEKILSAPKSIFTSLAGTVVMLNAEAKNMINKFETEGKFKPRKRVEADSNLLQPLPVVVVRNKSGNFLRLVRKEKEDTNKLHKKVTVWAGGHVRREDGQNGIGAIAAGALRELEEELRIYAHPDTLELIGAVYVSKEGSTGKHIAFVYEWRATTDDVAVALCNSEFVERTGTSLRGSFLPAERIIQEQELEDWSREILSNLFSTTSAKQVKTA